MASDPLNLDESGEWSGIWWLPGAPDEKVPGVLRYDSESGLSLSLIGAFENRVISSLAPGVTTVYEGHRTWDVIHGERSHVLRGSDRRISGECDPWGRRTARDHPSRLRPE